MIEGSPDSWDIITAYVNGQVEMSLKLRRETAQTTTKDDPLADQSEKLAEGESPSQDGEAPASQETQGWLAPIIKVRDTLNRLAGEELEKFKNKEVCLRGPLLARLELARVVHQAKEKINVALGMQGSILGELPPNLYKCTVPV